MKKQDYTATIAVNTNTKTAFKAVANMAAWWTENIDGATDELNGDFTVNFGETFVTFKTTAFVPGQKIVWLVTDCYLPWLSDKKEWNGTRLIAEVSAENGVTTINFMHEGLVPQVECYDGCVKGWDQYIKDSLYKLLTEGKGAPQKKRAEVAEAAY